MGAATAVVYYWLSWLLSAGLHLPIFMSTAGAYVLTHPGAYLGHALFTYRRKPSWLAYLKYWLGSGFTLATTALVGAIGGWLNLGISLVAALVIVASPITQILANELLTFRKSHEN